MKNILRFTLYSAIYKNEIDFVKSLQRRETNEILKKKKISPATFLNMIFLIILVFKRDFFTFFYYNSINITFLRNVNQTFSR